MIINAKIIKHEKVEVSDEEALGIAQDFIYKAFNIPGSACIMEGNLVRYWETHYGHGSGIYYEIVRKATDDDIAILRVLQKLNELRNEMRKTK